MSKRRADQEDFVEASGEALDLARSWLRPEMQAGLDEALHDEAEAPARPARLGLGATYDPRARAVEAEMVAIDRKLGKSITNARLHVSEKADEHSPAGGAGAGPAADDDDDGDTGRAGSFMRKTPLAASARDNLWLVAKTPKTKKKKKKKHNEPPGPTGEGP